MLDFWTSLLDTSDFPARWRCGRWAAGHGWLHILSDLGVWSAYLAIPIALFVFARRRKDVPFRNLFWLFSAFILLCGTTHLMEAVIFWWPAYRLAGAFKLATALISWATVLTLISVLPRALALRSPEELEKEIAVRRRVEAELRRSEQRFRAIFDQTFQFTGLMSADGILLEGNRTAIDAINAPDDQILGKPFWETPWWTHDPLQQDRLRDAVARAAAGETVRFEAHHRAADGSTIWVDFSLKPFISEGNVVYLIPEGRDITDRKRMETALRESEERFRCSFESAPIGMALVSGDGKWLLVNRAVCALTGYTEEELLTTNFQNITHPEDLDADLSLVGKVLDGTLPGYQMEKRYIHKLGHFVHVLLSVSLVRDEAGAPRYFISQIIDISKRKEAERDLAANEELLEEFVEHAPAAIAMFDTQMRYIRASNRWINDYHLSDQLILGRSHYAVSPEISEQSKESHLRVLSGAVVSCSEDPFPRTDGSTEWLQWEARPWHEPGGAIGGLLIFSQVITERVERAQRARLLQQAERILAEAKTMTDAVVGVISTACESRGWAIGEYWQVTRDGSALEFAEGWATPEVSGFTRACTRLKFPPGIGLLGRAWASKRPQVFANLATDSEFLRKEEAKEQGLLSGIAFPVIVGDRVVGVFDFFESRTKAASAEDVAILDGLADRLGRWLERKRSEEALRVSEERLRLALGNARHGLWDWDVERGTVHYDGIWATVHGYDLDEIAFDYAWWENSIHPDDKDRILTALNLHLASDALYDVEYRARRKDGSWVWLNSRGRVQSRAACGQAIRMMGTLHDISDQKRNESRLVRSVKEKEVMLREIHHRVKNNLAVISSLFRLQAGTIRDPNVSVVLREAQDRVHSMALVHEHLYNSPDLGTVLFGEYAKNLAKQMVSAYQLPTTPVDLVFEVDEVALTIEQSIPCGLILNELLSNCLKHAFRDRSRGKVVLSISSANSQCVMNVADDGIGMSESLDVRKSKSLGVRLVHILASQLVGTAEYRSHGCGTEVHLKFPMQSPVEK